MKRQRPAGPTGLEQRNSAEHNRLSIEKLAHELNSLLDGSMRCLRLAEQALGGGEGRAPHPDSVDDVLERLQTAREAMADMAAVLSRALEPSSPRCTRILHSSRTLGEEVRHLLATLTPMAQELGVALRVDLSADAAPLPAGPLGRVLSNGLRNAMEACRPEALAERKVEASITLDAGASAVRILIADTGDGIHGRVIEGVSGKAEGHGLGLAVCREIVADLDGRLDLRSLPDGAGAILDISIPVRSLRRP
jgi:signal transduction histidine kinase